MQDKKRRVTMKRLKKITSLAVAFSLMVLTLCGCNVTINNKTEETATTGMANPWRDCTEEEAYKYAPNGFSAPDGATDVHWSMMLPDNDPKKEYEMMVQMNFDLDGVSYCAREQASSGEEVTDISGMYYEWQDTEDVTLANWAGGNMKAQIKSFANSDESAKLCMWFDIETGYSYSLSCAGEGAGVKDIDIKAVAEAIYDPKKQIGTNAPEIPETCPEEATDEFLAKVADESAPSVDISGCDTFTQIVDRKLAKGMGYANEKIGDTDVLLVSSGTYDNLDGNMASIDAEIFMYTDDAIVEVGKVVCGGTAYPLAVKDNNLYVGSNHWLCKYTLENGKLKTVAKAVVEFNESGFESYYYESAGEEVNLSDTVKTKEQFDNLYAELETATVINFATVGGTAAKLPPYQYPGPELFYTVVYQYLIDELAKNYPAADVSIPCPIIVAEDESNKNDICVWGDFWIFNYDLNGDTLECKSGGSYPGCIHVKDVLDDPRGYVVTDFEIVGDGSDFTPTAKKIFGKHYDKFIKVESDDKERDKVRAQIIANYAVDNNLDIKAFKDYGWDPVMLPEENIDGFYGFDD